MYTEAEEQLRAARTEAEQALREEVRAFAEREVAPLVDAMEAARSVEHNLARLITQQGWLGATIDPAYGGIGVGHMGKTIIIEEISRISPAMGAMVQASQLGASMLIHFGSTRQKKRWLPKIAAGAVLPTIAVTEPASGSHVLGMETTARRDGKHYILNGRKTYVGNSHIADLHGVVARTGPGSNGLSAFLVENNRPGLTLAPHREALGLHGFSFGDLIFDNCRIPAGNLLGKKGQGLDVAYSSSILYGRPNLAAVALGIHQAIRDETITYAQERHLYGKPLACLDTVKQRLGQIESNLMSARVAAYDAVARLDRHQLCDTYLINAKYEGIEALTETAALAGKIHGAAALFTDRPFQRYKRDAEHLWAPAGTGDIQLLRLSEAAGDTPHPQWSQLLCQG
ncbi:acyl-CoA dehydrogenase [Streptomyces sp. NPDC006923]|uniref:acyl-CoA dehydrogenase family protein n=1 Tax=Streptomyces sp. NPDC006923 TaxID=3155355 RepID=UPI0033D4F4B7